MADAAITQHRVAQVEADVGIVGAGRFGDRHRLVGGQLVHDIRRQVVHHQVNRALAQLECPHDLVGHHLQHHAVVGGGTAEVLREGRQLEPIVHGEPYELVRARANRMIAEPGPGALGHHRHDQLDGERSKGFLQREAGGVAIKRRHLVEHTVGALARGDERRVDQRTKRMDHIIGRQLVPVVKQHALAQDHVVGQRVALLPARRQAANDAQPVIKGEQVVKDQLMGAL